MKRIKAITCGVMMLAMLGFAEQPKAASKVPARKLRLVRTPTLLIKSAHDCFELNRALGTEYFEPVVTAMLDQHRVLWIPKGELVSVIPADGLVPKDWHRVEVNTAAAKGVFWLPMGSLEGEQDQGNSRISAILIIFDRSKP